MRYSRSGNPFRCLLSPPPRTHFFPELFHPLFSLLRFDPRSTFLPKARSFILSNESDILDTLDGGEPPSPLPRLAMHNSLVCQASCLINFFALVARPLPFPMQLSDMSLDNRCTASKKLTISFGPQVPLLRPRFAQGGSFLCLGVATVARLSAQHYVRGSINSLLKGRFGARASEYLPRALHCPSPTT